MEYDNDRLRRRGIRPSSFFWLLLILLCPLVNGVTLFAGDWKMWIFLLSVSLVLWPFYMLFAREALWAQLDSRRYVIVGLLTLFSFAAIHGVLYGLYSMLSSNLIKENEKAYFVYSRHTFFRETLWIIVNMFFAFLITLAQRIVEEKEGIILVQRENLFFKLRYLRAQLNPHFLFNTLNSIYSLSLQKSDQAPEVVVRLADLMRYLIYECNEETIPLDKEVEFIRNYIELERIRYKADIRFLVEGDTRGVMIEPFLFISFIENGFKHAMDSSASEPFIYITLKVGAGKITLNVLNSTDADLESQAKRINGKGITNSKGLLELLYPGAYELDIIQTDKEEARYSLLRWQHAKDRLESLYPNAYDLDVILKKNAFTVSLILKTHLS